MIKYEIREGSMITQFDTLELAQAYNPNVEVFEVEVGELVFTISTQEKLTRDIEFGKSLINTFLKENRDIPRPFTMQDNLNLLQKFAPIETLSRLGDIKTILIMIQFLEVDDIFTQERKDSFILNINNYLQV